MKKLLVAFLAIVPLLLFSQINPKKIKLTGFVDAYYGYYSDSMDVNQNQKFTNLLPKSNNFGINTAVLGVEYEENNVSAKVVLNTGDSKATYADPQFSILQEAYFKYKLSDKFSVLGGLYNTHIGYEANYTKDNPLSSWTITSFVEANTQMGAKAIYEPNEKFTAELHVLNGFGNTSDFNKNKSVGISLSYAPNDKWSFSYNNLLSDNKSDAVQTPKNQLFLFSNLITSFENDKILFVLNLDQASQQNTASFISDTTNNETALYLSGYFILKYKFNEKFAVILRPEYTSDESGAFAGTFSYNNLNRTATNSDYRGVNLYAIGLGTEFKPSKNSFVRLEGKYLQTLEKEIFYNGNGNFSQTRIEAFISSGVWF